MITNQEVERVLDLVEQAYQTIQPLKRKRGPEPGYPDVLIIQLVVLKPLMQIILKQVQDRVIVLAPS